MRGALAILLFVFAPLEAQVPQPPTRQQILVKDGMALLDVGKPEAARAPFEEARTLSRAAGDIAAEAEAARGLGEVHLLTGDVAGARALFEDALRLSTSIHDLRGMGRAHNSLGNLARVQGDGTELHASFQSAADEFAAAGDPLQHADSLRRLAFDFTMSDDARIDLLRQALEIVRPLDRPAVEGGILAQWGDRLRAEGDYGAALDKLEAASQLLERVGDPMALSNVASSLASTYRSHGLPEEALRYSQRSLEMGQKVGNVRSMTQGLTGLSLASADLGRPADALDYARQALDMSRGSGNRQLVLHAIIILARKQMDLQRYADAVAILETGREDFDRGSLPDEAYFRRALAQAYTGVGRFDEAMREVDHAAALGDREGHLPDLADALDLRARLRLRMQDAPGARADADRAVALVERMRTTLSHRDFFKQGFTDTSRDVFSLAIDVDVTLGDPSAALVVAEQARGRAFQDLLAMRDLTGPAYSPGLALASGASVQAPDLAEMKAVVARLHAPLLAYWVAPHETFMWVITPGGQVDVHRTTVEATRLEALARAMVDEASQPDGRKVLRELYDLLIRPVRASLPAEPASRLTIIPHGPLFRVSFAALADERGRYLVERYEVHYAPAVGVLRFTEKNLRRHAVTRALLVGDPELPPPSSGDRLQPLASARLEVADAARLLGGQSEILIGRQATEARVRALAGGRDVLHFATHGVVTDRTPLESYLAFARSGSEAAADGRLTAAEIYGLDISADLVVLSACRSGAGKVTGDGIIGLTRGFVYAGAPSVLATLWDLADAPARYQMRRFYTHWHQGASKAAALRAAQLDTIRALRAGQMTADTRFGPVTLTERPALWAAFVLLGEP